MIQYARLLIEVPIEGPFPDHVDFFNEKSQLLRQPVQFEWKPTKCTDYHMLGHTTADCKKKVTCQEWRPKEAANPQSHTAPKDKEGLLVNSNAQVNTSSSAPGECIISGPTTLSTNIQAERYQSPSPTPTDQLIGQPNPLQALEMSLRANQVPQDPHG